MPWSHSLADDYLQKTPSPKLCPLVNDSQPTPGFPSCRRPCIIDFFQIPPPQLQRDIMFANFGIFFHNMTLTYQLLYFIIASTFQHMLIPFNARGLLSPATSNTRGL